MYKEFKHIFRKSLFYVEEHLGFFTGMFGRMVPLVGDILFKRTVLCIQNLPDYVYLSVFPFVDEMGRVMYDKHSPYWVNTHLVNGSLMRIDISEKTQRQIYSNKIFEAGLTRYLLSVLRDGDIVVDVGANVGYFTMLTAKVVGTKGRVVSIEPELRNLKALRENIKINDFQNVTVFPCAVGKEESTQVLNINPLNRGGNSLIPFTEYKSGGIKYSAEETIKKFGEEKLFQKAQVRTLDNIAKENDLDNISFMKMDVEGFEYDALIGAHDLIKEHRIKRIVCEISNKETRDVVLKLFREAHYLPYAISFRGEPVALTGGSKKYPRDILFIWEGLSR